MVFENAPADFKPKHDICICLCESDGEILLLKRAEEKFLAGRWGSPAGKKEALETPAAAMAREFFEETGIRLPEQKFTYFKKFFVRYPEFDFVSHLFTIKLEDRPTVKINPREHSEHVWIRPRQAFSLDLLPDQNTTIGFIYPV